MAGRQEGAVVSRVLLVRADVADATVAMLDVVQAHELERPGPSLLEAGEALGRELWPILGRSEQRLRIGVVVTHGRPRGRGLDPSTTLYVNILGIRARDDPVLQDRVTSSGF